MNRKFSFSRSISLLMAAIIVFGMLFAVPVFAAGDDYVLQGTHVGTDYNAANNAIRLTLPQALAAGYVYNIQVSFYVPSALNPGKSALTGPGIVLNGAYSNSAYKLPSSPGTIAMDTWKILNVSSPVMVDDLSSVDFRFVVNEGPKHPDVWYIDHIVVSQVGDPQPIPKWDLTISSLANTYNNDFMFGNIIEPNQLDTKTTNMYKAYYNVVTPENAMKPTNLSTGKGIYNFSGADSIINWAQQNGIKVHGHTLVWHSQSPNWLYRNSNGTPLTRSEARQNMQDYIIAVAGHFAGKVISWDVVNEALDGGSLPITDWKAVTRKDSPWYLAYANGADTAKGESGADYIYDAFVYARQADPNAILYCNDYNETDAWKREAIGQMAESLNAKWLTDPRNTDHSRKLIEGAGMQAHYFTESLDTSQVEASIQRFIQAGLMISVTELDVCYGKYSGPASPTLTQAQQVTQAIYYAHLFEIYKAYASHIQRITVWGKADSQSWRNTYSPILFDSLFAPKQAYYAVLDPVEYLVEQGLTSRSLSLDVATTANLVKKGDYFDVTASLHEATTANAVSFVLNYDKDKFEYAGNLGADPSQDSYIDGVTYLTSDAGDGNIKLTMMIPDYKAKDLISLRFRARENADIQNANNSITASANLVYKTSEGNKVLLSASGSTEFTSSGSPGDTDGDGRVTLLDLSNVIDMFGVKSGDMLWTKARFYDFNKNNVIDIADIVVVAKLII
jgi:GH35 family endo-1,4-beta-xylanase